MDQKTASAYDAVATQLKELCSAYAQADDPAQHGRAIGVTNSQPSTLLLEFAGMHRSRKTIAGPQATL